MVPREHLQRLSDAQEVEGGGHDGPDVIHEDLCQDEDEDEDEDEEEEEEKEEEEEVKQ